MNQSSSPHALRSRLADAFQPANLYDEMLVAPGQIRPHWTTFSASFDKLGLDELKARWQTARQMLSEHGVTYNVYGDPQGRHRPWQLDMMPLILPHDEWQIIERGLIQRARLFSMILTDLYGQQRLLRDGFLPPVLVFANPGFLRSFHGVRPPGGVYLHLHAVDLARASNGQWWVLSDRTQAPSGSGYALENRIVISRILPEEFRDCRVQRLAAFFQFERDTFRQLAPNNPENPSVVLLTPGPHNETYFEHAYLARYLGVPIVEGGDLTVRDRRVFIKTLEGLQQIDVIIRRVDDVFCDPLELREDSILGVAGLMEAAREGNVTVANALGTGIMESPAFLAFLPGLCQRLLGEELLLPSVATWWCGTGPQQLYVTDRFDDLVIKSAYSPKTRRPIFGRNLTQEQKTRFLESIRARPYDFVGQEQLALSSAPVWTGDGFAGRPVLLRTYIATSKDSIAVMPGGLTRVAAPSNPIVSMQDGSGSKDTWVLAGGESVPAAASALTPLSQRSQRAATELPSRVADNLFWLGRYAERLESMVRLLRSALSRMVAESASEDSPALSCLAQVFARLGFVPDTFLGRVPLAQFQKELMLLVYSASRVGSVREMAGRIRGIAAMVRDRFSLDTWRILNQIQVDASARPRQLPLASSLSLLNTLVIDLAAFSGMEMENTTRGHGWRFMDLGRRLERATQMANLLRAALLIEHSHEAVLEPLLEIADSVMTYRRRHYAQPELASVLDLVALDLANPRSLGFQLSSLATHAENLPAISTLAEEKSEIQSVEELIEMLEDNVHLVLLGQMNASKRTVLAGTFDKIGIELSTLSDRLTHHYFSHTRSVVSQA